MNTQKEILSITRPDNDYDHDLFPTEDTCEWMKEWLAIPDFGCTPTLDRKLLISGCDADYQVPIKYCPGCGREIEVAE